MDGVLVIDKPAGPTSHDVVARVRRATGQRRIGHTGTLDPFATGVLPLVLGRATRLARFLSGREKTYEATLRLGVSTDTHDLTGVPTGGTRLQSADAPLPGRDEIERALEAFRGRFPQRPPAFSAKRVAGVRSHRLARQRRRAALEEASAGDGAASPEVGEGTQPSSPSLQPVEVRTFELAVTAAAGDMVTLKMTVSAGFYVRSLAHDLGARLGCGAHLVALRRTASGDFGEGDAVALDGVESGADAVAERLIPLEGLLPGCPSVRLTEAGAVRASHGNFVEAAHCAEDERDRGAWPAAALVRLLGPDGRLVALASAPVGPVEDLAGRWPLHPAIVLT